MTPTPYTPEIPRKHYFCNKLGRLSPAQVAELENWLIGEKITYREAAQRIQERFTVSVSISALGEFYHRRAIAKLAQSPVEVRLELVIPRDPSEACRISILRRGGRGADVKIIRA